MGDFHLTVKELKNIIKDLPDDTKVYYQRIEDFYFEGGGWETESMQWEFGKTTECIRAFAAYYIKENNSLIIHAHY